MRNAVFVSFLSDAGASVAVAPPDAPNAQMRIKDTYLGMLG